MRRSRLWRDRDAAQAVPVLLVQPGGLIAGHRYCHETILTNQKHCSTACSSALLMVKSLAQVQQAMVIAPVYASAWVAKARQDKILRRVYQDVKNLQVAVQLAACKVRAGEAH